MDIINTGCAGLTERVAMHGHYDVECIRDGEVIWTDVVENTIATVGKNAALDAFLAGSSYSVTGPYLGLVSGASTPTFAAADTMASHAGWLESGNANAPTYSGTRKTASWNAAANGAKALSSSAQFIMSGAGTLAGPFMVYGSGAVNTIDSTAGTLLSAGAFAGGNKIVGNGDTLNVSFTISI